MKCPECGEATDSFANAEPMSDQEAKRRKAFALFEDYGDIWDAARGGDAGAIEWLEKQGVTPPSGSSPDDLGAQEAHELLKRFWAYVYGITASEVPEDERFRRPMRV